MQSFSYFFLCKAAIPVFQLNQLILLFQQPGQDLLYSRNRLLHALKLSVSKQLAGLRICWIAILVIGLHGSALGIVGHWSRLNDAVPP